MKKYWNASRWLIVMIMVNFLLVIGCSEKDSSNLTVDEEEIQNQIIEDADEIIGVDILGESDATGYSKSYDGEAVVLSKSASPIDSIKGYGRVVRMSRRDIQITVAEDTMSAEAEITFLMKGNFVIRAENPDGEGLVKYTKPLEHEMKRIVRFVRNTDPEIDRRWLVSEVSAGFGRSKNGTMSLSSVNVTIHSAAGVTDFGFTDPLAYFIERGGLPQVSQGDTVTVEVGIANSNADDAPMGWIHRGKNRNAKIAGMRVKHLFNDEGTYGDRVAGDGIYTVRWIVGQTEFAGVHVGALDFVTHNTVYESDADVAPYNSLIVALPYRKVIN
ncbi:hypothetical protein L6Q79_13810 [bacterium]|nr:hypothetical protein [bacterium]NUN45860.1 hypothetical protein [bacterium]